MLPYPPSTVSIEQFSFTDCSTIWVSLIMSLIDFHHILLVEFKLVLFTRLHLFQHSYLPVPLYDTFNHVGVTLDCHLYFKSNTVVNHVRTANFERHRVSSIRHLITTEATATLESAITLSRLDYCTATLSFLAAHNP